MTYYGNGKHAPHVRDVLRDSDGQWFLNYLECVLWAEDESGPFYSEFEKHKNAVETKLAEHKANPTKWFELVPGSSKSDLAKFVCKW